MNSLDKILKNIKILDKKGNDNISISDLSIDSRNVNKGTCFIAIKGLLQDGHKFIESAVSKGASLIICEKFPDNINKETCYIKVEDSRIAQALLAANFFDNPSEKLKLVGVTGTNGKTTIATLLFELTRKLGYKSGLLSTIENRIEEKIIKSTHTTPDPIMINYLLAEMVENGCEYCFMEVSSHAVKQHRIRGLNFVGGIFTNLTHDHLDYHQSFDDYLNAKKSFFDLLPAKSFALYNNDDKNGKIMVQNCLAETFTYSLKSVSDYKARILEHHFEGMLLNIDHKEIWLKFIGRFNAYNLLAIYGTAIQLGFESDEILRELSTLKPVAGRFEFFRSKNNITAIVDYAHTPDALKNVLFTISEIVNTDNQVITVIGTGGDRDKTKRPVMASIAVENSNKVILTSDNPRTEDPDTIISDMYSGVNEENKKKVLKITDRREAIKTAIMLAESGDTILIAGKGHENYQEIKGVRHHFDDKEEIIKIFKEI